MKPVERRVPRRPPTTSFAAFRLRDYNRAFDDPDHPNCYVAAAKAQSQGWETEVNGRLAPGRDISAGYTYRLTLYLKDASGEGEVFDAEDRKKTFKLWSV